MISRLTFVLTLLIGTAVYGQKTDTIKFYSKAFNAERTIFVNTPEFYKYQSKELKLPVVYLLDGQHEWFVNPVQNSIRYLQYTHQIPQAIIVTIPLINRNKECGISTLEGDELPLYNFIVKEVDEKIQNYQPGDYKLIIGHSFSASFSLYAYLKNPSYFSAVISNTPLDHFKELLNAFSENKIIAKENIFISVGGKSKHEDFYHRSEFDALKKQFPNFFNSINYFIAENAGHNAVPILATPNLLTKLFSSFKERYSSIALVNEEYKIINKPNSIEEEIKKIENSSKLGSKFYPPELAELNGLASRYWNSNLIEYAIAVYELGTKYYPYYYDFHLQLYELFLPNDKEKAKRSLNTAYKLLTTIETDSAEREDILKEIKSIREKNGW